MTVYVVGPAPSWQGPSMMNRRDFLASAAKASAGVALVGAVPRGAEASDTPRIDFRSDLAHARRYRILDARTGEDIPGPIFHADARRGVIRLYRLDERGHGYYVFRDAATGRVVEAVPGTFWANADGTKSVQVVGAPMRTVHGLGGETAEVPARTVVTAEPAWEEVRRPIRLARKV